MHLLLNRDHVVKVNFVWGEKVESFQKLKEAITEAPNDTDYKR